MSLREKSLESLRRLAVVWKTNQTTVLNLVQTIGIIVSLAFALWSHHAENTGQSAEFMLRFSKMLDSGRSGTVEDQLDEYENLDKISLQGVALDEAIDDFLSDYELLDVAYRYHLSNNDMAEDAFSWDLEKGLNDRRVRGYISFSMAQEDDIFDGVIELAKAWKIKFAPIKPYTNSSKESQ